MLNNTEREMQLACQLHTGDELSQARFLRECTPEKILSYIEWADAELESLQAECNDKDEEISALEDELAEAKMELEALKDKTDREISSLEEQLEEAEGALKELNSH